jgi:hypothetical protein
LPSRSCKLYSEKVAFGLLGDASQVSSMQFPASEELRRQLMLEFTKSKRPQKVALSLRGEQESGEGQHSSVVYLVPTKLCAEAVALDFLALCVSPPEEGGGLRSIEGRLEPLLLPTNNVEHSAHVLSVFEKKVCIRSTCNTNCCHRENRQLFCHETVISMAVTPGLSS